ncbi:hypothetical protein LBMAG32_09840 [Nitrosomonadaceae bacterium]|nr:tetratricopeptide repeat protein [Nitrosomonadaceae bacterium]MDW7663987.1 tetratricopeptide repeat protein [Nitrosomonadaceae bacterium]GDX61450.1 hypothetical protein LBMAG32_09840 [Nitrosomonadaceae bacterium]
MMKRTLLKIHHSLTMLTLKKLLLTISMGCLMTAVNAGPMDDARTAYNKGDYKEALGIWRPLADQGDVDAQYNIGLMYEVTQNYKEAVKWYRLAAVQGNEEARYNIGVLYAQGHGVTQNYKEAVKWLRLAAEQGDAKAQYNIGVLYAQGHGVTQNYKEAVKWYRLAAVQEDAVAQYSIGVMYHNGQGVTKDYIRAHMWYNLSSLSGYANGTKDRDLLAKEMTPQQIEKAQNMARECEAKDFKEC